MTKKPIVLTLTAYLLWLILAAGSVVILLIGRTALLSALAGYASKGFSQTMRTGLMEKGYFIFGGLAALSFCIGLEYTLTKAPEWRIMLRKAMLAFGVEFSLIAIATIIIQIFAKTFFVSVLHAATVIVPAAAGGVCFALSVFFAKGHAARKKDASGTEAP